jgi:hypothetical protein
MPTFGRASTTLRQRHNPRRLKLPDGVIRSEPRRGSWTCVGYDSATSSIAKAVADSGFHFPNPAFRPRLAEVLPEGRLTTSTARRLNRPLIGSEHDTGFLYRVDSFVDRSILLSSLWAGFMNRGTLLIVLTAAGSAFCVWPAATEPSIDFPRWILLVLIALITGLATILSNARWLHFAVASTVGVLAGLWTGLVLFPPSDAISASYYPLFSVAAAMAVFVVSLRAALLCRNLSASRKTLRRSVWLVFASCVAFGPIALALTPPVVGHRVATNDRMAAERFESLKSAVEGTVAEGGILRASAMDRA